MSAKAQRTMLDPMEITFFFPFDRVTVLPCFGEMKRSPKDRFVMSHVFEDEFDAEINFGIVAWHAPFSKEDRGFFSFAVPALPLDFAIGPTLDPRRIKGLKKHECNFLSYNTESQMLTIRISLARASTARNGCGVPGLARRHRSPRPAEARGNTRCCTAIG